MKSRTYADVSVVIPVKNSEASISRALKSVFLQELSPAEVIVIDNGSSDDTVQEAQKWEEKLPLQILSCSTPGSGAARNIGLINSKSSRVAFLDSDDLWYPSKLKTQIEFMDSSSAKLSGTFMHYLAETGRVLGRNDRFASSEKAHHFLKSARGMPVALSTVVVQRSVFEDVGLFDESFIRAQDFEWLCRVSQKYELVIPSSEILAGYVLSSGSSTASSYVEQYLAADLVRARISGKSRQSYQEYVQVSKIPKAIRSGEAYRKAGISFGRGEKLKGLRNLILSLVLDPLATFKKIFWQSTLAKRKQIPHEARQLFLNNTNIHAEENRF